MVKINCVNNYFTSDNFENGKWNIHWMEDSKLHKYAFVTVTLCFIQIGNS